MGKLIVKSHPDPIEEVLSYLTVPTLKYLAREFDIMRKGSKQDIVKRLSTAFIPLKAILETLLKPDLVRLYEHFGLAPLPSTKMQIVDKIYDHIIKQFRQGSLLECLQPKYEVIRSIGEGGQGAVFLARESITRRIVAIKHAALPEGANPLYRELQVLASLDHPNIERLYTFEISEACPHILFLILEYCGELTLEKALFENNVSFSDTEVRAIIKQTLDGLAYYHSKGVVHGDISPSNLSLLRLPNDTKAWQVKYIDFGASRVGFEPITTPVRNESYTAPEVSKSSPIMASDVFSVATVVAELLAKQPMFKKRAQKSDLAFIEEWLNEHIGAPSVRNWLRAGLLPAPQKRVPTGIELRQKWVAGVID